MNEFFKSSDVMPFWIADMEFKIAEPITIALKNITDRGMYAYEDNRPQIFSTLAKWFNRRHSLDLKPAHFIQVSNVLSGISLLIQELSTEEDHVLIQTPVYHKFSEIVSKLNRKLIKCPLKLINDSYEMDFENLENKFKENDIKIMILCNPHNPVGRVWKLEELSKLLTLADTYNVRIISDEIHADIVYNGSTFNSILSFKQTNHIALIGSPSKTFGMQSIANGYVYIKDEELYQRINSRIECLFLEAGNTLSNYATIAAYEHGEEWLTEMLAYLEETIQWIKTFLTNELPQVKLMPVEGTYQIWLDFRELNLNEKEMRVLIVEKSNIALAPGKWFGSGGIGFQRMTIASPLSTIQTAFQNLKKAVLSLDS